MVVGLILSFGSCVLSDYISIPSIYLFVHGEVAVPHVDWLGHEPPIQDHGGVSYSAAADL